MNTQNRAAGKAVSYLLLALWIAQQQLPGLIQQYPQVRWLSTLSAIVAAFWRAYDYFKEARQSFGAGAPPAPVDGK